MALNDTYIEHMQGETIPPRWFVKIEFASDFSDPVIFTSNKDMASIFTTEDVLNSTLIDSSFNGQVLKRIAAMGTLSAKFNDVSGIVHDKLREKLEASKGVRSKRIQLFEGFEGDSLANYVVTQTAIIGRVSYLLGVYTITGKDVEFLAKDANICTPVETYLIADIVADKIGSDISIALSDNSINSTTTDLSGFKIGAKILISLADDGTNNGFFTVNTITSTKITTVENISVNQSAGNDIKISQATIEAASVSNFEMTKHGGSYTDAPNVKVGYIIIDKTISRYESNAAGLFQNVTQGVLGSVQKESVVNTNVSDSSKTVISSYTYYELPAIEFLYGILLGPIYSQPGEFLNTNDRLDIDPEYIRATDFINIGNDLWNPTNDSVAKIVVCKGQGKINAKAYIEAEILPLIQCNMPVYGNGEWGLQRDVLPGKNATPSFILDASNSSNWSALIYDAEKTINQIDILWHWSSLEKKFKRITSFIIPDSIVTNGVTKVHEVKLKLLNNSRHTESIVAAVADAVARKVAYPPLSISCNVTPEASVQIENGLVGLCNPAHVKDFSGSSASLNRAMKVVSLTKDLRAGRFSVSFEGTSGRAGPLIETVSTSVLSASNYTTFATTNNDIAAMGSFTLVGDVGHINTETFTGGATLGDIAYYYEGDLTIDAGIITGHGNVVLLVDGFCQMNFTKFDGKGNGIAGSTGVTTTVYGFGTYFGGVSDDSTGIGGSISGGGWSALAYTDGVPLSDKFNYTSSRGTPVRSQYMPSSLHDIAIEYKNGVINGLKEMDLRGIGGPSGGPSSLRHATTYLTAGGDGGDGGASFTLISRGSALGASSFIDTSGADGGNGVDTFYGAGEMRTGAGGGGHNGAILIINDGVSASPATLTGKVIQKLGGTQTSGERIRSKRNDYKQDITDYDTTIKPWYLDNETLALRDVSDEWSTVKYLREAGTPGEEPEELAPVGVTSFVASSFSDGLNEDGTVRVLLKCTWVASPEKNVDRYEIEYTDLTAGTPTEIHPNTPNRSVQAAYIPGLLVGNKYRVGIRTINLHGEKGDPVFYEHTLTGKSTAPAALTAFATTAKPLGIEFSLTAAQVPADKDLRSLILYTSTTNDISTATNFPAIGATPSTALKWRYDATPGTTLYHWAAWQNNSGLLSATYPPNTSGQAQTASFASGTDVQYSDLTPLDDLQPGEGGGYNRGVFNETFEIGNADKWNTHEGTGVYTFQANGVNGGKVANINGYSWKYLNKNIPFDPAILYRIRCKVRMTVAPTDPFKDLFYCGVEGYSQDGTTLLNTVGADTYGYQHCICASGKDMGSFTLNTWQEFTGYFRGHTTYIPNAALPSNPSGLYVGTTYFRPIFIANHNAGDGVIEIDYISIDALAEDADQIPESATKKWAGATGADITAPSVSMRINKLSFTGALNGGGYIHGFDVDGSPSDTDGYINYNGAKVTVPRQAGATIFSSSAINGYIMFDTAKADLFFVGGFYYSIAIAKKVNGVWSYDDAAGGWTTFIPASTYTIIGSISSNGTIITTGEVWASGMSPDVASEAGSDQTQTAVDAGVTTTTGGISNTGKGGLDLGQTGALPQLWLNSSTWQAAGIQLQYNTGAPRAYIGDGSNTFLEYSAGVLTVGTLKTSSGSGKRVELNPSASNDIFLYDDRGDGTIEKVFSVGTSYDGPQSILTIGSTNYENSCLTARTKGASKYGIYAEATGTGGTGVRGVSSSSSGVSGYSTGSSGVSCFTGSPNKAGLSASSYSGGGAQAVFWPNTQIGAPTFISTPQNGYIVVQADGVWIRLGGVWKQFTLT